MRTGAPNKAASWTPLGVALRDFHNGATDAEIVIASDVWESETTPVAAFYRPEDDELPELERQALALCRGRVLDLGAGAGRHALELQRTGHDVVAVDILDDAVEIMRDRGVVDPRRGGLDAIADERVDTVLMLMHGLGVVGDLRGLGELLERLDEVLEPGGRLVCDSADLAAVLDAESPGAAEELGGDGHYLGEVEFRLRYRDIEGEPYRWLFVDPTALGIIGGAAGFDIEIVAEAPRGAYLAVLEPSRPFTRP